MSYLYREVLDHGSVRLTASTAPAHGVIDFVGPLDLLVVRAARTSYAAAWRAGEDEDKDEKLIYSLMRRQHTGPFEHAAITFEVVAPIFVFRQWHRHRTQSYSEQSARYIELEEQFYVPALELMGKQDAKEKQARTINDVTDAEQELRNCMAHAMVQQNTEAFRLYQDLLKDGMPRELARTVLPVATYSKMVVTASLLNWFRFLGLRCDEHAQYEIRVYADQIKELLRIAAPVSVVAFEAHWDPTIALKARIAELERLLRQANPEMGT